MGKTHAEKIREAVTDLVLASPNEIMNWIKMHYPNDKVNPRSYRADIIGCSVNHSSSKYYSLPKFLWFEEKNKKYRLAKSDELPENQKDVKQASETTNVKDSSSYIDGVPVFKLSVTGQVIIPPKIREKMGFQPGDTLAFIINKKGILEVRKAKLRLDLM